MAGVIYLEILCGISSGRYSFSSFLKLAEKLRWDDVGRSNRRKMTRRGRPNYIGLWCGVLHWWPLSFRRSFVCSFVRSIDNLFTMESWCWLYVLTELTVCLRFLLTMADYGYITLLFRYCKIIVYLSLWYININGFNAGIMQNRRHLFIYRGNIS